MKKKYDRTADIHFITDSINHLRLSDRIKIVKKLDYDKLIEKGEGTVIKFSDIPNPLLYDIANQIRGILDYSEMKLNEELDL